MPVIHCRITADVYIHLAKDQQQQTARMLQQAIFARHGSAPADQTN